MKKVAVAMSGGVDSSVAAALMVKKYGKENVFGITMRLFCYGEAETGEKSCCSLDAVLDAKSVCDQLGIPHYAISFEKEFEKDVVNNFIQEYEIGHTPNPCIRCNQFIKFEHLMKKAKDFGAEILVTGHYARISEKNGKFLLEKGIDKLKDQSYFLYTITEDGLSHTEFPIGNFEKTQTRKLAAEFGLKTAEKTESQDICFVPTTVEEFLETKAVFKPGKIVDKKGNIVGEHSGIAFYTVGQRRGLGGGFTEIMYVISLNKEKNEVIIGPEEDLFSDNLTVSNPHWIFDELKFPMTCTAKIRYQAAEADCVVEKLEKGVKVTFSSPQKAITPGQSVVFYDKDIVLGGGIIS